MATASRRRSPGPRIAARSDEGEGDESVAQWRAGHESFWHSAEVRAELGDPGFTVNDDTLVLAQRFRLVHIAADVRNSRDAGNH